MTRFIPIDKLLDTLPLKRNVPSLSLPPHTSSMSKEARIYGRLISEEINDKKRKRETVPHHVIERKAFAWHCCVRVMNACVRWRSSILYLICLKVTRAHLLPRLCNLTGLNLSWLPSFPSYHPPLLPSLPPSSLRHPLQAQRWINCI